MFEKGEARVTIIGPGVKMEGDFSGQGDVELYGEIRGSLTITGFLKVGPAAQVTANVSAERAVIGGYVKGRVTVKKDIELLPTARVVGDIKSKQITVAKGASLQGKVMSGEGGDREEALGAVLQAVAEKRGNAKST